MFRNRTSSQKPNDELYENFKQSFPGLRTAPITTSPPSHPHSATSLTDALESTLNPRHFSDDMNLIRDHDPTPRGTGDHFRGFTPSIMDPNSFAFSHFANQPPGYYTPTPGGTNTLYHNQAGDLHTPGFTLGLGTPLSGPSSDPHIQAGHHMAGLHFHHNHMLPSHLQNPNPFSTHQQPSFAPHQLQNQPTQPMQHFDPSMDDSPMNDMSLEMSLGQDHSPMLTFDPSALDTSMAPLATRSHQAVKFRYHTTLNAPTAMIKHADEIPVTYLNKGQTYAVTVIDQQPENPGPGPIKYRTFVRISFEDDQQRKRPGACWQLWKEGRGTSEAHQRGGRLQAVEFVDQSQLGGPEDPSKPKVELESASFDGFCVTWQIQPNSTADVSIGVRFNFLSTDFSHSKGVKGIPVRLCSKTEMLTGTTPMQPQERMAAEICFGKVKLFRDHGAERKLSNDVAHVKKTIDKLKHQIAQAESGIKDFGKRKRSNSISKASSSNRPGKVPKHKRTWSMSSANSQPGRPSAEEDLHLKLATLQDMFTSTRPVSVLYLKGLEDDDPDLHPVRLTGEPSDLTALDTSTTWDANSISNTGTSSVVSPTPSVQSIPSASVRPQLGFQQPTPFPPSRVSSNEWRSLGAPTINDLKAANPQHLASPPDQPTKIQRQSSDGDVTGWIEAVGVDPGYQPPAPRVIKPVACLFVQPRIVGKPAPDQYYRAVYLMQRTLSDLTTAIASKCDVEPTQVLRTIRVTKNGISVLLDDEGVREMPEGVDLVAEFSSMAPKSPIKREWDAAATDVQVDGDVGPSTTHTSGFELKLLY